MDTSIPLTPFEEFMLVEDRLAYPNCGYFRLGFSGLFVHTTLESAFRKALQRHPLLTSRVLSGPDGRLKWTVDSVGPDPILWRSGNCGDRYPHFDRIDITAECGLRLVIVEDGRNSDLLVHAHHAICDGLGMFQFFEDMFAEYALAAGLSFTGSATTSGSAATLLQRGTFGLTWWQILRMLPKQLRGFRRVVDFFRHRPLPLVPGQSPPWDGALPDGYPFVVTRQFFAPDLAKIRAAATVSGGTVNDVLIRDLFLSLEQWRLRYHPVNVPGWLRLSIPVNLRTLSRPVISAVNMVSTVFLDRNRIDLADPHCLLDSIQREMQQIKRLQLGLTFPLALFVVRSLPGGIARRANDDRCQNSCIFSNLGAILGRKGDPYGVYPLEIGTMRLENIELVPILRPFNYVSITAIIYAGKMFITLHYDARVIPADQAESLADLFMAQALCA